jgi:hypothetical protein
MPHPHPGALGKQCCRHLQTTPWRLRRHPTSPPPHALHSSFLVVDCSHSRIDVEEGDGGVEQKGDPDGSDGLQLIRTCSDEAHTSVAEEAAPKVMVQQHLWWAGLAVGEGNPRMGLGRPCRCRVNAGEGPPPLAP